MKRAAALAVWLVAAACASGGAAYGPQRGDGAGYSETQLEPGLFRVSFRGDRYTPKETVQIYLFYRAAELTLASGHDTFATVSQNLDQTASPVSGAYYEARPVRNYVHNLYGVVTQYEPHMESLDGPGSRFVASADIRLVNGRLPPTPGVFDAREVIAALQDRIRR